MYLDKNNGHYQSKLVMQKLARALEILLKVRLYVAKIKPKTYITLYLNPIYDILVKFDFNRIHHLCIKDEIENCERKLCKSSILQLSEDHLHLYLMNGNFAEMQKFFLCIYL